MSRLPPPTYVEHVRAESARFRAVLAETDPAARVPACPGWDAADLLWHLGEVQWFWSRVLALRPATPEEGAPGWERAERPAAYADLLAFFDAASSALLAQLEAADPRDPAWTWSRDRSAGFVMRRQAHEALVHRVDAEQAAGRAGALDPALAADGIAEILDQVYGTTPEWAGFTPDGRTVLVETTDTDDRTLVALGRLTGTDPDGVAHDELGLEVVSSSEGAPGHPDVGGEADVVVQGPAAALDLALWRRAEVGSTAAVAWAAFDAVGDREALADFVAVVTQPFDDD